MKLYSEDKEEIVSAASEPFFKLAKQIDGKTSKKLALKVFREEVVPELERMRAGFPFWQRLPLAGQFLYESPKQPQRRTRYYHSNSRRDGVMDIPKDVKDSIHVPTLEGITTQHSWSGGKEHTYITQEKMNAGAMKGAQTETLEKSSTLRTKGERVAVLLQEFLKDFTMPEQIPYSLPQLTYFLKQLDFRKRGRWTDKPPLKSQKRPRVIVTPTDELRTLIMEATILHQSLSKNGEVD